MKKIQSFSHIKELIREIQDILDPVSNQVVPVLHQEFAWLMHKDNTIRFSKEHPKCVLPLNIGRTIIFMPVCNREGIQDKNIIELAMKFVSKLSGQTEIDVPRGELAIIKGKLENLMQNHDDENSAGITQKSSADLVMDKLRSYSAAVKTPPASEL